MLPQGLTIQYLKQSGGDSAPVDPNCLMDTPKILTGGDFRSYLTSRTERETRVVILFELMAVGGSRPTLGLSPRWLKGLRPTAYSRAGCAEHQ